MIPEFKHGCKNLTLRNIKLFPVIPIYYLNSSKCAYNNNCIKTSRENKRDSDFDEAFKANIRCLTVFETQHF